MKVWRRPQRQHHLWLLQSKKQEKKKKKEMYLVLEQPPFGEEVLKLQPTLTWMSEGRGKPCCCHLFSEAFSLVNICFLGTEQIIKWNTRLSTFKHMAGCLSSPFTNKQTENLWIHDYCNKHHNGPGISKITSHFSKNGSNHLNSGYMRLFEIYYFLLLHRWHTLTIYFGKPQLRSS